MYTCLYAPIVHMHTYDASRLDFKALYFVNGGQLVGLKCLLWLQLSSILILLSPLPGVQIYNTVHCIHL
jgi:hypothetical protein